MDAEYYYDLPDENLLDEPAPIFKRFIAFIIDLLVFNLVLYNPFIFIFQSISGLSNELMTIEYLTLKPELISIMFGAIMSASVILCFYLSLSEFYFGRTIGKQLMGLWVNGKSNLWGYVIRNLFKSTWLILLPFDCIGIATQNQRFIDKFLGLNVFHAKSLSIDYDY